MKNSKIEMRENLPVDIFTNEGNFEKYQEKIKDLLQGMSKKESYDLIL